MWISRKLTSGSKEKNFAARASALIDRFNKPLPPIIDQRDLTLVIAVSGPPNVGKSTFIRFGLQNLIAKHDSNRPDLQCHHTKIMVNDVEYPLDVIEMNDNDTIDCQLPQIHGGLVCYDTTDRDSLDCLPDLLNFYLSRSIPTFLVGLKSDLLEASNAVDPNLIQQLVELFDLRHFQVDAFSESGVEQMRNIYRLLLKQYYPSLTFATTAEKEIKLTLASDTPGFVYAPTTTMELGTTSGSEADPDKGPNDTHLHAPSTLSSTMVNKRATNGTYYSYLSHRRGSKDSSESFGIGFTSEDIVDRLLSTEYNKSDENIIPIFLTFFRKFMKPYELVKTLVSRFENEGLSFSCSPTESQKRIHSIFSLWLSHYWNDFYGPHARKHIILFLDRISKYESLTYMCDSLAPLVVREPPTHDPDRHWGLVDDENIEERLSWPPTPNTPSSFKKRNEKKDSAYASGNFSMAHFQPTPPSPLSSPTTDETFVLKRMSSNLSYRVQPTPISTNMDAPPLLCPNLNRMLCSSSHRKVVTHSESHPDLRSSYARGGGGGGGGGPLSTATSDTDTGLPRRAEFAGGLINIDNAVKSRSQYTLSRTSSIATTTRTSKTAAGNGNSNGWTSSLGHQLMASSFISSFRQHRSDKDQTSYIYKTLMKATDAAIADQLTWIEAELFSRIMPREFIRNIWSSAVPVNHDSSNNAVTASIAHFNFISAWVATTIVTQPRLSKRVALLEKFMSLAVALRNLNNYNSLMAILAGINSASILRLKQTRQAVSTKKVYKQFQSLERLMSTDRSFSSYRMALKATASPGIPYLGIHNQDLVSLAEANKDFRADGTIHWDKFRLMGETIMAIMRFKYPGYSIEPDAHLLTFIADSYILSEDEQYKKSISMEPRLGSSSNNRIRDLWLRM